MYSACIHRNIDPMIGIDVHDFIPPIIPLPPPTPNVHIAMTLLGGMMITASMTTKTTSTGFFSIHQGSDIGPLIPHLPIPPANILFPLHIALSGSTSNFGAFSVMYEGKPVAIAVGVFVGANLNCQGPTTPPLSCPTGVVISWNTNMAGFSIGDLVASLISLAANMLISLAASKLGGALFKGLSGAASRVAARSLRVALVGTLLLVNKGGQHVVKSVTEGTLAWAGSQLGGQGSGLIPLGDIASGTNDAVDSASEAVSEAMSDYFNGPDVPQVGG